MSVSIDTGTDELLCGIDDGVATITLNRPEKRNALSNRLTPALRQTLLDLETHRDVGCIVITGAGRAFCAGGDVSGMGGGAPAADDEPRPSFQDRVRILQRGQETLTLRLFEHPKPTIAALPGAAAGAGLSIALACDLRIGAASSFITTAFRNVGFSGDYGGSWLLTQLVGTARARELFFTARRVPAEECLALGIFNQVVPDDELQTAAASLARDIAGGPPIALGYMKENLNRALTADLKTCLAMEADRMIRCGHTDDHREAVAAFLAKRQPQFYGR
ncbi:MAG: enoyl-CoA hydratase [Pseudomonadales bacterium]